MDGFEIFQGINRVEGIWVVKVRVGFLGLQREGMGLDPSPLEARRKAVREVLHLWKTLPEEARITLRELLEGLDQAPASEPPSVSEPEPASEPEEPKRGRVVLARALEVLIHKKGEEAVRSLYRELGLEDIYPGIPPDSEKARAFSGQLGGHWVNEFTQGDPRPGYYSVLISPSPYILEGCTWVGSSSYPPRT